MEVPQREESEWSDCYDYEDGEAAQNNLEEK